LTIFYILLQLELINKNNRISGGYMKSRLFYTLALLACMAVGSVQGMSVDEEGDLITFDLTRVGSAREEFVERESKRWFDFAYTLEQLVRENNLAKVKEHCAQGITTFARTLIAESSSIYISLKSAFKNNNLEMVKFLVSTFNEYVDPTALLVEAAKSINPAIFDYVVTKVQEKYPESWRQQLGCVINTPLEIPDTVVQKLITAGADVNIHIWSYVASYDPKMISKTPLHDAINYALLEPLEGNRHLPTVKLLLANGARTDIKDSQGKTVRDLCEVKGKHKDTLRVLRDLIIAPKQEALDIRDATRFPLPLAKMIAEYAFADDQELLDACEECSKDPMARRVLHLLESGCNPNVTNSNGKGTLAYAAECGNACAIEYLLTHKANTLILLPEIPRFYIPLCDEHGTTPLHHAAEQGSPEVVKLLISETPAEYRRALVNAATTYTTVHSTDKRRRAPNARSAAKRYRAGKNIEEVAGTTPLMGAAGFGHPDVVKLLLQHGADTNMRDAYRDEHMPDGRTALDCAKTSAITGDAQQQYIALLSR
jgi:ankyrin repeat protein